MLGYAVGTRGVIPDEEITAIDFAPGVGEGPGGIGRTIVAHKALEWSAQRDWQKLGQ